MASPGPRWLTRGWQACAALVVAAAVAGCVSMPDSGPVGSYRADQENAAPALQYVGPFVSGPGPNWTPSQIVQGFLDASASYPIDAAIAREYLAGSASRDWDPGWGVKVFSKRIVPARAQLSPSGRHGGQQAEVDVAGTVQAEFNGTGQYVSVQSRDSAAAAYPFSLIKVNGQWRISNPPDYRLLTQTDFPRVYEAQDLYFFGSQGVLVPDSVFVPKGTSPQDLVTHLVQALTQDPSTAWLQNAAGTDFPDRTTVLGVSLEGGTAIVNLGGGVTSADKQTREQMLAQLVWTLAGSTASPSAIQSVELEINGTQWVPPSPPCGTGQNQNPVQKLAAYQCYDPYPAAPASFYYANDGLAWSRCGSEAAAKAGSIGPVVPVIGRNGALGSQPCGTTFVQAQGQAVPPPRQPRSLPAASMAAVSPDGKYLALVSSGHDGVYAGPLSGAAALFSKTPRLTGPHITAVSWDRNDDLWIAQSGGILMMSPGSKAAVPVQFPGNVTALSVAPDGVRIALIVQNGAQSELELAAISISRQPAAEQPGSLVAPGSIAPGVQLGPNVPGPDALAWYDADDLVVLAGASSGNMLWEVPVDGQQASGPQAIAPGTVSIAADSGQNALVAGLSNGKLAISASIYGPWQTLGSNGQDPAYPGLSIWLGDEKDTRARR